MLSSVFRRAVRRPSLFSLRCSVAMPSEAAFSTAAAASGSSSEAVSPRASVTGVAAKPMSSRLVPVVVDKHGLAMPLEGGVAAGAGQTLPDAISVQEHRKATKELLYHRRALQVAYDSEDIELYASAWAKQFGDDDNLSELEDAKREDDYALGDDPLDSKVLPFRVDAVRFETSLSWNVAPGSRAVDRRAALSVRGADLGLPAAVLPYVRAIAGPHYNPHSDLLRISVEKYKDAALNKRAALEKLLSLVEASIGMHGKFGPMKAERRFPAYRNH